MAKETLTTPWTRHPRCRQSLVPEDKWSYSAFILLFVEKFLRKPKRPFNEFYGKKTFVMNRYLLSIEQQRAQAIMMLEKGHTTREIAAKVGCKVIQLL
ncbi:1761_t:CDS:2 [Rhizophagus irregularis]|nr:1761_t:CDS:2 [Rhizophagus irregularis]